MFSATDDSYAGSESTGNGMRSARRKEVEQEEDEQCCGASKWVWILLSVATALVAVTVIVVPTVVFTVVRPQRIERRRAELEAQRQQGSTQKSRGLVPRVPFASSVRSATARDDARSEVAACLLAAADPDACLLERAPGAQWWTDVVRPPMPVPSRALSNDAPSAKAVSPWAMFPYGDVQGDFSFETATNALDIAREFTIRQRLAISSFADVRAKHVQEAYRHLQNSSFFFYTGSHDAAASTSVPAADRQSLLAEIASRSVDWRGSGAYEVYDTAQSGTSLASIDVARVPSGFTKEGSSRAKSGGCKGDGALYNFPSEMSGVYDVVWDRATQLLTVACAVTRAGASTQQTLLPGSCVLYVTCVNKLDPSEVHKMDGAGSVTLRLNEPHECYIGGFEVQAYAGNIAGSQYKYAHLTHRPLPLAVFALGAGGSAADSAASCEQSYDEALFKAVANSVAV